MEVKYVDHMGTDLSVVNAARVSFDKKSEWATVPETYYAGGEYITRGEYTLKERDQGLIQFLARGCTSGDWDALVGEVIQFGHNTLAGDMSEYDRNSLIEILNHVRNMPQHWTPFGHTAITLHIKAPIFVARQLGKHQVGMVWNEVSRRYVSDAPEFYVPDAWRKAAENVKQGSSDEVVILDGTQRCQNCGSEMAFLRPEDEKMKKFCSTKCQGEFYRKKTPEGWARTRTSRLKQSAEKRNISFSLVPDDLIELGQPEKCKYLEVTLDYAAEGLQPNSPSINRIDASKGYEKGNIEIISNMANSMLLNATEDQLRTFVRNVSFEKFGVFFNSASSVDGLYDESKELYRRLIEGGLCAEQARMFMPQSQFTEWWWTGNLYSFANVFIQRSDSHAQKETQEVAKMIGDVIEPLFPVSWKALTQ